MAKSRDAFRTISEVADAMSLPAHVLRFWESKFTQIRPVKRAGGRRYYRPEDAALLAGIQVLLHERGLTIKGAQRLIREEGVRHVMDIGTQKATPPVAETKANPSALTPHRIPPEVYPQKTAVDGAPEQTAPDDGQLSLFAQAPVANPTHDADTARDIVPRGLAYVARATPQTVRARKDAIAPIVARLEALLDQMRA